MHEKTQRITQGAMIIAVFGVLLLINRQSAGLFEDIFLFIYPIPMVAYAAKYGFKASLPVFVCMCFISLLCSTFTTIFYAITQAAIGMIFGTRMNHRRDMTKTLLLVMMLSAAASVLSTVVLASLFGFNVGAEVTELQQSMKTAFENAGVTMPDNFLSRDFLTRLFIISMAISGAVQGFLVYEISLLTLRRLRFPIPKPTPVFEYYPPLWTGIAALVGLFCYYFTIMKPFADSRIQNLLQSFGIVSMMYLVLFGLFACTLTFKILLPRSRVLPVLLSIMLFMMMSLAVAVMGFMYTSSGFHDRLLERYREVSGKSDGTAS
jgi:MFS family permease